MQGLVLPFSQEGSRDQTLVIRLGDKSFYLLSHIASLNFYFVFFIFDTGSFIIQGDLRFTMYLEMTFSLWSSGFTSHVLGLQELCSPTDQTQGFRHAMQTLYELRDIRSLRSRDNTVELILPFHCVGLED